MYKHINKILELSTNHKWSIPKRRDIAVVAKQQISMICYVIRTSIMHNNTLKRSVSKGRAGYVM